MALSKDTVFSFGKDERGPLNFIQIGFHDFRKKTDRMKFLCVQPTYMLHYVCEGRGTLVFNGNTYQLNAGDLFFLPPNETHMYYPSKSDPWCYFWFSINHDSARDMAKMMGFSRENPVRQAKSPQTVTHLLTELFTADVPNSARYYMTLSTFMQILVMNLSSSATRSLSDIEIDIVANAKELIELNYSNIDFTVNALPQMLHISHAQLTRIFKTKTGTTLVKYLIDVRITHAAILLNERNFSVRELVDMVGFGDERNFTRHFKEKYGMTVKEYRKQSTDRRNSKHTEGNFNDL